MNDLPPRTWSNGDRTLQGLRGTLQHWAIQDPTEATKRNLGRDLENGSWWAALRDFVQASPANNPVTLSKWLLTPPQGWGSLTAVMGEDWRRRAESDLFAGWLACLAREKQLPTDEELMPLAARLGLGCGGRLNGAQCRTKESCRVVEETCGSLARNGSTDAPDPSVLCQAALDLGAVVERSVSIQIPLVWVHGQDSYELATLILDLLPGTNSTVEADARLERFLRDDFKTAVATACRLIQSQGFHIPKGKRVYWRVQHQAGGVIQLPLEGPSAGAAFALALGKLLAPEKFPELSWFIVSAGLLENGALVPVYLEQKVVGLLDQVVQKLTTARFFFVCSGTRGSLPFLREAENFDDLVVKTSTLLVDALSPTLWRWPLATFLWAALPVRPRALLPGLKALPSMIGLAAAALLPFLVILSTWYCTTGIWFVLWSLVLLLGSWCLLRIFRPSKRGNGESYPYAIPASSWFWALNEIESVILRRPWYYWLLPLPSPIFCCATCAWLRSHLCAHPNASLTAVQLPWIWTRSFLPWLKAGSLLAITACLASPAQFALGEYLGFGSRPVPVGKGALARFDRNAFSSSERWLNGIITSDRFQLAERVGGGLEYSCRISNGGEIELIIDNPPRTGITLTVQADDRCDLRPSRDTTNLVKRLEYKVQGGRVAALLRNRSTYRLAEALKLPLLGGRVRILCHEAETPVHPRVGTFQMELTLKSPRGEILERAVLYGSWEGNS